MFWLDGLDIPLVQFFDASFAEGLSEDEQPITRPAGDSFARYGHNLLPGRFQAGVADVARFQLSLRAHPRRAGDREDLEPVGSLPRPEAALHQSGQRRFCDADHRHVHSAAAEGLQDRPVSVRPTPPCSRRSRAAAVRGSASRCSNGAREIFSSCRAGTGWRTRRTTKPCCSASRIGRCSRSLVCSGKIGQRLSDEPML